ncbi:MAG: 3D domain-containing protein [Eubacteriaceae bacterium]
MKTSINSKFYTAFVIIVILFFIITLSIKQEKINQINEEICELKLEIYETKLNNTELERNLAIAKEIQDREIIYFDVCVLTAYTLDPSECGKPITSRGYGITAIGKQAVVGVTAAADWSVLPFGTDIFIEGIGIRTIQDKGGGISDNKIDIYFGDPIQDVKAKREALLFGKQKRKVWIVK